MKTISKKAFIKQVQELANLPTEDHAEDGTMIVLSLLSHRLTPDEREDAASQLPEEIKKLWNSDTWFSSFMSISKHQQLKYRKKEELFAMIRNEAEKKQLDVGAEQLAIAVFHTLKQQISKGEVEDIAAQLPTDLKQVWLAA